GIDRLAPNFCSDSRLSTRRLVHSPSCATSTTVASVTLVRGSKYASTPRRDDAHSSRWARSLDVALRSVPGFRLPFRHLNNAKTTTSPVVVWAHSAGTVGVVSHGCSPVASVASVMPRCGEPTAHARPADAGPSARPWCDPALV